MSIGNRLRLAEICAFYVMRLWRSQPYAISLSLCAAIFAGAAAVALGYASSRSAETLLALRAVRSQPPVAAAVALAPVQGAELPLFDGAAFTSEFLSLAREVGVPTDEVGYVLESGPAQPYVRYRITLDTKSGYLELRKFVAALNAALPNVGLDAIRCRRDDAGATQLACQLALSAFFRKEQHG